MRVDDAGMFVIAYLNLWSSFLLQLFNDVEFRTALPTEFLAHRTSGCETTISGVCPCVSPTSRTDWYIILILYSSEFTRNL